MALQKSFKISATVVGLFILAGASFAFVQNSSRFKPGEFDGRGPLGSFRPGFGNSNSSKSNQLDNQLHFYTHPTYGFTIAHSSSISIGTFEEEAGDMAMLQDKDKGTVAQVYIQEFDEKGELTPQRIVKDLPGKKIENGKYVLLDGQKVMMFDSEEEGVGKTWEVWFARSGYLYQISTKSENREVLEPILSTWRFE